jgi:hypothetical protein
MDSPSAGKDFVALLVTAIYLLRKMSVEFEALAGY